MMPRPKTYDDALADRLRSLAADRIAQAGMDGLALRPLAAAAGTSTSAVYAMFTDKSGLVEAVLSDAFARFATDQAQIAVTDNPLEDMRLLGLHYRTWALANPALYDVMFSRGLTLTNPSIGDRAASGKTLEPLVLGIRRLMKAGIARSADAEQIARSVWASVHGFISLELAGEQCTDEQYAFHLDMVARGFVPPGSQPIAAAAPRPA